MVKIFSFPAIRPVPKKAADIASAPYDVVSTEEARECIEKNPDSFMKVIRSDAMMQDLDPKDSQVYATAKRNLEEMIKGGLLKRDDKPGIYVYRIEQDKSIYTGFVADVSVKDYEENRIKRHELTRYEKEEDRTMHIDTTNANTGLVVLLYRDPGEITSYVESLITNKNPDGIAKSESGALHKVFRISDDEPVKKLVSMFEDVGALYIADGHHRAKSSVNVAQKRRAEGRVTEEAGRFMAVIFAESSVKIYGYSRLVTDLKDYNPETFLNKLSEVFEINSCKKVDGSLSQIPPHKKTDKPLHVFHMYMGGKWYELSAPVENPDDIIASLDVSVLQKKVMEDILGITDPRGDQRLQYLGGSKPVHELEESVDSGMFKAAFSMQPVKVKTVLKVADNGEIMPPKSTWFEPKLLSGLVIHTLD
ncbi:uncharacterized protein (DUF1015 family) [Methanomicrobium sp. W14]|uniref:DUF1015 domain-containing protein n=1 Tax=Methanomicrobium sp. W14 TaxID=2817839 RepID=UPI001AE3E22E|nr:DUF1015 family protein [Methanomicrobium sp. W14]MBP2133762.1 uncharacterized protein (DUF1015 family) [Methanomicrobium sp. W14]